LLSGGFHIKVRGHRIDQTNHLRDIDSVLPFQSVAKFLQVNTQLSSTSLQLGLGNANRMYVRYSIHEIMRFINDNDMAFQ